jgi:cytochrome c
MWPSAALGALMISVGLWGTSSLASEPGDPVNGQQVFRACMACHTVTPGGHTTGPSLADIWEREAGTVDGFSRYSPVMKQVDVVWDAESLDEWLENHRDFLPGNRMTFRGIPDAAQRRDLIAYLRGVSEGEGAATDQQAADEAGGMLDLEALEANNRITAIDHCGDTYTVTAENGEEYVFWEFNNRIKTDSSERGPPVGHPVIVPASMRG